MSAAAAADIQRRLTDEGREQSLERRASDLKAFLSNLNASRRILGRMIESNRWNMAKVKIAQHSAAIEVGDSGFLRGRTRNANLNLVMRFSAEV
jgi:hypothetical protein